MCAPGVESFRHLPYNLEDPRQRETAAEAEEKDAGRRQLIMQILPRLAGLLSQGAEILLDTRWGEASVHQKERQAFRHCIALLSILFFPNYGKS